MPNNKLKKCAVATANPIAHSAPTYHPILDGLRHSWFLIIFIGTAIYWAAKHDVNIIDVQKNEARIAAIEPRVAALESGIAQTQIRLDMIQYDLSAIKKAVMK